MTQCDQILQWLSQGYTLTTLEAVERFGIMALSQRCTQLRARGWPVETQMIETKTGKRIACYSLKQGEQVSV